MFRKNKRIAELERELEERDQRLAEVERAFEALACGLTEIRKTLADMMNELKEQEKGGDVLVPPCKKGDKIYRILPVENRILEETCVNISYDGEQFHIDTVDEDNRGGGAFEEWLGDIVFLSLEEAERELRENRGTHLDRLRRYYRSENEWSSLEELERELEEQEKGGGKDENNIDSKQAACSR